MRARALSSAHIRDAITAFPDEPVVRYSWPADREVVLWERASDALRPRVWRGVARQEDETDDEILYDEGDVTITMADVRRAIEEAGRRVGSEFEALLTAPPEEVEKGEE